ncbi:MAG: oligosaccharyl transferase STT3 subunit [Candidatus Aramenus sulfurataquae]|uniref:dolichyl-phosphooligosaccharide-protein glycotransferase n=1 Tax=Candidatus Aramenus sulfurataquae TaxID=1326980 RepID=W7KV71_9CREN|nr:MAG: oligosaccharyl transferase STT3 subunit [Candidatus Aramenus sulfurataquae]
MQSIKGVSRILKRTTVIDTLAVTSIALVSILIRALSADWPLAINGFDSWYLFYNALLISQAHGNWYAVPPDVHAWYPWGYFIELGDTIGLPFIVSLLSLPFSYLGANAVYTVTMFMDVALAGLGVVATYLAVDGITKSRVGALIASIVVAVSPALTYKNIVGGLPKDSWGGVFVLFSIYLLNYAIEKKKPAYGALAGVPLFLAEITWGGSTYIDLSLLAGAFLIILLNRNDLPTAKSFTLMALVTAFLTSFAPNSIGFLSGLAHGFSLLLVGLLLFLDLYLKQVIPKEIADSRSLIITAVLVFLFVIGIAGLSYIGVTPIPSRYYAIINPFYQITVPIDKTVAEYIPQSISAMLQDFGIALFLSILGIYYAIRNGNLSAIWLMVLGVVSIYGTSEQPYLFNYTAYMVAPLAGIGVAFIVSKIRESGNKVVPVLFLAFVGLSMVADASSAIMFSNEPNAIVTSASPYPIPNYAWVEALNWIRENTPQHSFILSWWDYGYWVEVVGNRSVIDENNTLNGTQIKLMAEMFLNNESFAANVLMSDFHIRPYNGSPEQTPAYVVAYDAITVAYSYSNGQVRADAFIGYPVDLGGPLLGYTTSLGDIGKAMGAMTTIAGYPINEYINSTLIEDQISAINQTYGSNPATASEAATLENYVAQSYVMAWTPKTYQSLIIQMFIEAVQTLGYPVIAPFSVSFTATGLSSGVVLPPVHMQYFAPVYIALYPLYYSPNGYIVYIMVMVYEFVQPGYIPYVTVVTNSSS